VIQSDEMADTGGPGLRTPSKVLLETQDSSTFPKRRGRPPGSKNRPKIVAIAPRKGRPRSRRLGRPPGSKNRPKTIITAASKGRSRSRCLSRPPGSVLGNFEPHDIPVEQIVRALNRLSKTPSTDERVARASRRVFRYTKQWPWQWAARFLPRKKWTVPLVEELAQLLRGIYKKSVKTGTGHGTLENTRRFLYNHARDRDQRNPQMTLGDLHEAFRYFKVKTKRKIPRTQQTSQTTPTRRVTDLVDSDTETEPDEIPTEENDTNEGLIVTQDEIGGFDGGDRQSDHCPVLHTKGSVRLRKRTLSRVEDFNIEKRPRVAGIETDQVTQSPISISPSPTARAGKFKTAYSFMI
jgi:hypothetical protein